VPAAGLCGFALTTAICSQRDELAQTEYAAVTIPRTSVNWTPAIDDGRTDVSRSASLKNAHHVAWMVLPGMGTNVTPFGALMSALRQTARAHREVAARAW
jgi:hypothetical protein